jgi:hypothetical protein
LNEVELSSLSPDWASALTTIEAYPGTAPIYNQACAKYTCPGGVPATLSNTPQTLQPQTPTPASGDNFGSSVAGVGGNLLIGSRSTTVNALGNAGAAYLFDTSGNVLKTFTEPTPATNDNFGSSVAGVGGNVLIGSPFTTVNGLGGAGAAYLFDTNGNLLKTLKEPIPAAGYEFGSSVAGVGSYVLIGSPFTTVNGLGTAGAAYLFDPTSGNVLKTFTEPTPATNDKFGSSVAGVGGNVLIGSLFTTVNGLGGAGAAYLFDTNGNLLKSFKNLTPHANDNFGSSVAGVGGNVLIGSPFATVNGFSSVGAAYLFDTSGNLLKTFAEPTLAIDNFGFSVTGVGGNVLIGSRGTTVNGLILAGAAYLFDTNGNLLKTLNEPTPATNDNFGFSVAGVGSNVLIGSLFTTVNGLSGAGAAYLFGSNGGFVRTLREASRPVGDSFGWSVSGSNGNILVGAPQEIINSLVNAGAAYLYDTQGNLVSFFQEPSPAAGDEFGYSIAGVGNNVLVGAPYRAVGGFANAGVAYLFDLNGNLLTTYLNPIPSGSGTFGLSVATVGNNVLIGAPTQGFPLTANAGAAYLFDTAGTLLKTFTEPLLAANDNFGFSVGGVGSNVLIGSPLNQTAGKSNAGAAYLFDTNGNLLASFKEPAPAVGDNFGRSVAGVGNSALVGSPFTTVSGDPSAGAAYLFDTSGATLKTFNEPTLHTNDYFGFSVAGLGGNVLIGSPLTTENGLGNAGAAYLFDTNGNPLRTFTQPTAAGGAFFGRAVAGVASSKNIVLIGAYGSGAAYYFGIGGLRSACASTLTDCKVVHSTGGFMAGTTTVSLDIVALSLRSAEFATNGTQMALTIICNKLTIDPGTRCSAFWIDGNVWGPDRENLAKSSFIIVNAEPYFYLRWHWWDLLNQKIVNWSYWWYGANAPTNWFWAVYLWWRSYVRDHIGVWQPYWWYGWYWTYKEYWFWWSTSFST